MMLNRIVSMFFVAVLLCITADYASAQQADISDAEATEEGKTILQTQGSGSKYEAEQASKPLTFRQYRAQMEMRNRMARIEYQKWAGIDTLRPTIGAMPYYQLSSPPYVSPFSFRYYQTPLGIAVFRY